MITADIPGTWYANTDAHYLAPQEAAAHFDLIEWAGTQPWSNGKVGLSGVSYLSSSQWGVAALKPPHLAAINPWEGWSDTYNEIVRHGDVLRLIVKGRDIYTYPKPMVYMRHEDSVNRGLHRLHTGQGAASYLLVPVVEVPDEN